ncbi:hypothetical protein EON65_08930 [archaeon]|nr:MAG: hypothetical protein EON65_08930 [archaeon]
MHSLILTFFVGSGFSAYAKLNPFAAATKNTSFGLNISSEGSNNLRPNFTMPAPLTLPSPKSPKANPFSSPSPVHNPFMTIVESKDELWKVLNTPFLFFDSSTRSLNL